VNFIILRLLQLVWTVGCTVQSNNNHCLRPLTTRAVERSGRRSGAGRKSDERERSGKQTFHSRKRSSGSERGAAGGRGAESGLNQPLKVCSHLTFHWFSELRIRVLHTCSDVSEKVGHFYLFLITPALVDQLSQFFTVNFRKDLWKKLELELTPPFIAALRKVN